MDPDTEIATITTGMPCRFLDLLLAVSIAFQNSLAFPHAPCQFFFSVVSVVAAMLLNVGD
jgi:hypothetical protein